MCTVTWRRAGAGYQVFFNRDERRTRKPAAPPALHERHAVRYLSPTDGDAGGSWLAVNEHGVTLGLLNYYSAERRVGHHPVSRGQLLVSLISCRRAEDVAPALEDHDLAHVKPFLLLAFDPDRAPVQFRWDGMDLDAHTLSDAHRPVTTSSFDSAEVIRERCDAFEDLLRRRPDPDERDLADFHNFVHSRGGAYGVRMDRPDARTVSFSRVTVGGRVARFLYAPRDPGGNDFLEGVEYTLPLA